MASFFSAWPPAVRRCAERAGPSAGRHDRLRGPAPVGADPGTLLPAPGPRPRPRHSVGSARWPATAGDAPTMSPTMAGQRAGAPDRPAFITDAACAGAVPSSASDVLLLRRSSRRLLCERRRRRRIGAGHPAVRAWSDCGHPRCDRLCPCPGRSCRRGGEGRAGTGGADAAGDLGALVGVARRAGPVGRAVPGGASQEYGERQSQAVPGQIQRRVAERFVVLVSGCRQPVDLVGARCLQHPERGQHVCAHRARGSVRIRLRTAHR